MTETSPEPDAIRVDKWLWHARFFKTRGLATKLVSAGRLRVNAQRVSKPSRAIVPGDVLTFPQAKQVRVVRVLAIADRRGPAPEAQALYDDLSPPKHDVPAVPRYGGKGRPTGKDRRQIQALSGNPKDDR